MCKPPGQARTRRPTPKRSYLRLRDRASEVSLQRRTPASISAASPRGRKGFAELVLRSAVRAATAASRQRSTSRRVCMQRAWQGLVRAWLACSRRGRLSCERSMPSVLARAPAASARRGARSGSTTATAKLFRNEAAMGGAVELSGCLHDHKRHLVAFKGMLQGRWKP